MSAIWVIDPGMGMQPGDVTTIARATAEPLKVAVGEPPPSMDHQAAEIIRQYEGAAVKPAEILVDIATLGSAMYHALMQAGLPVAAFRIVARSPQYRAERGAD